MVIPPYSACTAVYKSTSRNMAAVIVIEVITDIFNIYIMSTYVITSLQSKIKK
jgi:hypothetical protein